jgi:GST-like protein
MTEAVAPLALYGAAASGSVAIEAALTLIGVPYEVIEGATWAEASARERVAAKNPMRQVPTLVLANGEVMTESAAILLHLAEAFPRAHLAPPGDAPSRPQYLRWMVYVSSSIYALHWIKPVVGRIGAPPALRDSVVAAVHDRIAFCWRQMDAQLAPGRYLLGDELGVLDLYVAVVSRFGPWRRRFAEAAPKMAAVVRRVDAEPRLVELWARRFPNGEGLE